MPSYLANINLNKNEVQNARIQNLASDPSSPVAGQIYFNTGSNVLKVYDGSTFVTLATGTVADATTSSKGVVQLAGDLGGTSTAAAAPIISAGAIDAGKIAGSLKPSGSAAAGTEALRAIGTTASTALAGNTRLDQITAPTASVSLNSQKLTNVLDPTSSQDAATKSYVDTTAQGLDAKASVRAATTAAGTLATSFENGDVIDGVTLATGDRILVKDQAAGAENGIYTVNASGAPTRATDADSWTELVSAFTFVEEGTTNADSGWTSTVNAGGTLGTTAVTWVQFSGAGQITAGTGLTKTGNSLDVIGTTNRITANADSIDISSSYVGQTSITTLGTIGTGTWQGTAVGTTYGGTGQTTAKAGRETGLGAAGYYTTATHSSGTTISVAQATHGLRSSKGLIVQLQDESTGNVVNADVSVASSGDVTATFAASQSANSIRVTVVG
jgi:hypothetical protein